LFTEFFVLLE